MQFKDVKLFNKLISPWNLGLPKNVFDVGILNIILITQEEQPGSLFLTSETTYILGHDDKITVIWGFQKDVFDVGYWDVSV